MKKGRKKNPCRLYFFHLNCKHLFGCKANRTFILLSRFRLIMSTLKRRRAGRCCGFGEAARTAPLPEARQEVLIAPGEHEGPLRSSNCGSTRRGARLRGSFEEARGAAVPWRSAVAASSALIAWDGKSKERVQASALGSHSGGSAKGGWGCRYSPRLAHSD